MYLKYLKTIVSDIYMYIKDDESVEKGSWNIIITNLPNYFKKSQVFKLFVVGNLFKSIAKVKLEAEINRIEKKHDWRSVRSFLLYLCLFHTDLLQHIYMYIIVWSTSPNVSKKMKINMYESMNVEEKAKYKQEFLQPKTRVSVPKPSSSKHLTNFVYIFSLLVSSKLLQENHHSILLYMWHGCKTVICFAFNIFFISYW